MVLPAVLGCAGGPFAAREASSSLPEAGRGAAVAVLPFANATGSSLRVPPPGFARVVPGPLDDPYTEQDQTVTLLLQQRASVELARRGYVVVPPERVARALPNPPEDVLEAARAAAAAGFGGPALVGTLRRFHLTETGLLQVWLDLALVDPAGPRVLWTASARRPAHVVARTQTWQDVLLDAGGPIFEDAFGPVQQRPASREAPRASPGRK